MNDTIAAPDGASMRVPLHYWPVAVLSLLWNGFGCFDYVMTQTNRDQWFAQMGMTEAQILSDYEELEADDLRAALAYAAQALDHSVAAAAA